MVSTQRHLLVGLSVRGGGYDWKFDISASKISHSRAKYSAISIQDLSLLRRVMIIHYREQCMVLWVSRSPRKFKGVYSTPPPSSNQCSRKWMVTSEVFLPSMEGLVRVGYHDAVKRICTRIRRGGGRILVVHDDATEISLEEKTYPVLCLSGDSSP